MAIYADVGTMFTSISLFGAGILFAIAGLLVGIIRGWTKETAMYPLMFSVLAWTVALILPNAAFAFAIFVAGAISLTMIFNSFYKEVSSTNIAMVAITVAVINILLIVGFAGFQVVDWNTSVTGIQDDINTVFVNEWPELLNNAPNLDNTICPPNADSVICYLGS